MLTNPAMSKRLRPLERVTCQRIGEFSAKVHKSEAVPLWNPVVQIFDSLSHRFIHADGLQLREWYGDISILPAGDHEHIARAAIFGCHLFDFDRVSLRNCEIGTKVMHGVIIRFIAWELRLLSHK